jgi:hypothetical protein
MPRGLLGSIGLMPVYSWSKPRDHCPFSASTLFLAAMRPSAKSEVGNVSRGLIRKYAFLRQFRESR